MFGTRKFMSTHHNKGHPWKTDEGDAIHQTSKHFRANDGKNDRKATLQALHTAAVVKVVQCHERNVVLDGRPPPISNSEKELTRKELLTIAQLRSGYCRLLGSYKSRIKKDANLDVCARRLMMSSISSFARLTRLHWYRQTYGADRRSLSGNSAISRRETHIEMNMDWKANNNNIINSMHI